MFVCLTASCSWGSECGKVAGASVAVLPHKGGRGVLAQPVARLGQRWQIEASRPLLWLRARPGHAPAVGPGRWARTLLDATCRSGHRLGLSRFQALACSEVSLPIARGSNAPLAIAILRGPRGGQRVQRGRCDTGAAGATPAAHGSLIPNNSCLHRCLNSFFWSPSCPCRFASVVVSRVASVSHMGPEHRQWQRPLPWHWVPLALPA